MHGITEKDLGYQTESFNNKFYDKFFPKSGVVIDVGAYVGVITKLFNERGNSCISIEGSPINFDNLVKNVGNEKNILINVAVSDKEETNVTCEFNDCNGSSYPKVTVNYVTLDKIFKEVVAPKGNNPLLVKMDIEGMETLAMKGASHLLREVRPLWQLSYHENHRHKSEGYPGFVPLNQGGFDFNEFFKLDYHVYNYNGERVKEISGFEEFYIVPKELNEK